jgi:hypothetical protein
LPSPLRRKKVRLEKRILAGLFAPLETERGIRLRPPETGELVVRVNELVVVFRRESSLGEPSSSSGRERFRA